MDWYQFKKGNGLMAQEIADHLWVVDEGVARARVGGKLAGAGQLQALDDSLQE